MKFKRKRREKVDITLISMIDVLFVLLLFFMVSTTFNRHTQLKINLPEAKGSASEDNPNAITIEIDAKGVYNLILSDGQSHLLPDKSRETLTHELSKLVYQSKDLPFVIMADDDTPHKAVITVLDIAGQVGFSNITFPTKEPEAEE